MRGPLSTFSRLPCAQVGAGAPTVKIVAIAIKAARDFIAVLVGCNLPEVNKHSFGQVPRLQSITTVNHRTMRPSLMAEPFGAPRIEAASNEGICGATPIAPFVAKEPGVLGHQVLSYVGR